MGAWEALPESKRELSAKEIVGMKKRRSDYDKKAQGGFRGEPLLILILK
jgi:hypothetical protein